MEPCQPCHVWLHAVLGRSDGLDLLQDSCYKTPQVFAVPAFSDHPVSRASPASCASRVRRAVSAVPAVPGVPCQPCRVVFIDNCVVSDIGLFMQRVLSRVVPEKGITVILPHGSY